MEFLNRIELKGIVGRADLSMQGDSQRCRFSVLTQFCTKRNGESVIEDTWFNVGAWEGRGMPDLEKILPGTWIHVIGRIRTYKYTAADGNERFSWEINPTHVDLIPREETPIQPQRNY